MFSDVIARKLSELRSRKVKHPHEHPSFSTDIPMAPLLDHDFLGIPNHKTSSVALVGEHSALFAFDNDPRQPFLERQVSELLIRAVADAFPNTVVAATDKKPQHKESLFDATFRVLANKVTGI